MKWRSDLTMFAATFGLIPLGLMACGQGMDLTYDDARGALSGAGSQEEAEQASCETFADKLRSICEWQLVVQHNVESRYWLEDIDYVMLNKDYDVAEWLTVLREESGYDVRVVLDRAPALTVLEVSAGDGG